MNKDTCEFCYYQRDNLCKRNPPSVAVNISMNHVGYYTYQSAEHPEAFSDGWCGEFKRKECGDESK